jgi:hypothetical protein
MMTMFGTQWKSAAGMLTLSLLLGGLPAYQALAASSPDQPDAGTPNAKVTAAGLSADQFDQLRALIKPRPGGFDDLPWLTDLWEARQKAAAEGKPLLVWVGDGHPLGWT